MTAPPSVLRRLQLGIEAVYRVETCLEIEAFLIDEKQRHAAGVERAPREQLLVKQGEGELEMGLFLDGAALENLARHDPSHGLDDKNFADFCLAVEGVSHFIYVALCAAGHRRVSALELELQAEVDKFVCCLLVQGRRGDLHRRLYDDVTFAHDLHADERARYLTANGEARRYASALDRRFLRDDRLTALLADVRSFYRMTLDDKLRHINRA